MNRLNGTLIVLSLPLAARAHDGKLHGFEDLPFAWSFDPLILICLTASAIIYITGLRRLWLESGTGHGITRGQAAAFAGGWVSLFIALVSPLHPWGEVLFSAHMTQHEILMLISAPLLVLARPFIAAMWAVPRPFRRTVGGLINSRRVKTIWSVVSRAAAAWLIHAVALWVWHIPSMFQATLHSNTVQTLQHASFFLSAMLLWWAIIYGKRGLSGYGAGVLYLFTTSIQSGLLGVFLTLTSRVLYPEYAAYTQAWGLTPIEDQQLGGLIMWIPAGLVYIAAALVMFAGWLNASEEKVLRRERRLAQTGGLEGV